MTGISSLSDNLATLSKTFYVVKEISTSVPKHVYARGAEVILVESPMNSTPVSGGYVKGGEDFDEMTMIGDTEDWYQVRINEIEGFVKKAEVDDAPGTTGGRKVSIIKPANADRIPLDYTSIDIEYKLNFVLNENEAANVSVMIVDQDSGFTVYNRTYFKTGRAFSTTGKTFITRTQKELPAGRYQLQMTLKTVTGDLIAAGNTHFTVGEYNAEDAYRTVWKQNLLNDYNLLVGTASNGPTGGMIEGKTIYLPMIDRYVGGTKGVLYDFMSCPAAPSGFSRIYRAAAMLMVNQFNKAYYDERVGNDTSNYMITDAEMKKLSIQQIIMNSCDASLGKGSINTNTLSSATIASNIINQRNSDLEVISESVQALKDSAFAFADGIEVYLVHQGNPAAKVVQEIKGPIQSFVDVIADMTDTHFNGINDMKKMNEIIDAYVDDYEKAMMDICDDSISYLKHTYFGDSWSGSAAYVDTYKEQAQIVVDNYAKLKGDSASIRAEARSHILSEMGLTEEMLSRAMDPKYGDEISTIVLQKYVNEVVKDLLKQATEAALCKIFNVPQIGINDVQYGYYLGAINSRLASAVDDCIVFEDGVIAIKPEEFAKALGDVDSIIKDMGGIFVKELFLHILKENASVGTDLLSARNSVLKAVGSLYSDCWSFGKHFAYAIRAEYDASQQTVGLGKFDKEGCNLIISLDLISSVKANAGLVALSAANIDSMSISELDVLRSSVLTMLNDELLAVRTYESMKTIRQNAGKAGQYWLTEYKDENGSKHDYTWLTDAQISVMKSYLQKEINLFARYAPPTVQ